MEAVIISVTSMLIDPNLDSPANVDAAKMFRQKRQEYNKKLYEVIKDDNIQLFDIKVKNRNEFIQLKVEN